MDNSDKENIKNNLPIEKPKTDEKNLEIEETLETSQRKELMHDIPVSTSVKHKSKTRFENEEILNIDNVQKESDDNLKNSANTQNTDLDVGHSKFLSSVISNCDKIISVKEGLNLADQSTTEDNIKTLETDSEIRAIEASINKYLSNAFEHSQSDPFKKLRLRNILCTVTDNVISTLMNIKEKMIVEQQNANRGTPMSGNRIHSKNFENSTCSKCGTKVTDENLLVKEQVAGDGESPSKFKESGHICPDCKQRYYTAIISPSKRKCEETVEERKRRRSGDISQTVALNDESITDSLNVRDASLHVHLMELENHLLNILSHGNASEGIEEQGIAVNHTDLSADKNKMAETTNETDFERREIQIPHKICTPGETLNSDKVFILKDSSVKSTRNHSISHVERNVLDTVKGNEINLPNTFRNESSSDDNLTDSKNEDTATENISKLQEVPKTLELDLSRGVEEKLKCSTKMTNQNLQCDIPLHMSQTSAGTSKSEEYPRRNIATHPVSPIKLSDSESDLNQFYNEPVFINLECMKNDPDFVARQKQIFESISNQRQQILSMKPKSDNDDKEKLPKLLKEEKVFDPEFPPEMALRVYNVLYILIETIILQGKNPQDFTQAQLKSELRDFVKIYDRFCLPHISYALINYRHYLYLVPATIRNAIERTIEAMIENNDEAEYPTMFGDQLQDTLPLAENQRYTNSPPPQNGSNKMYQTNSPKFKERTRLDQDLTILNKDARCKKSFNRENLLILPNIWSEDEVSISEIEPKIHSEENLIQIMDDNQQVVRRNSEDSGREKSGDQKFILKDKEKRNSPDEKLSESAIKYKISSFMEESPNSSQSDSLRSSNECKPQSMTEKPHQPEAAQFISTAYPILTSQSELSANQHKVTKDKFSSENIIDSKTLKIYVSSLDDANDKDKNSLEEEQSAEKEFSTVAVSEKTYMECKQDKNLTSVISPGKRKSEEITKDERKRKRSADNASVKEKNDENLTDSLNVQDTVLHAGHSKHVNNSVNTVVSIDDTAEECVKEQELNVSQTDQSPISYKITESTIENNFGMHDIQTLENASIPDQTQSRDKEFHLEYTDGCSIGCRSVSFVQRRFLSSFSDNVGGGKIINQPNKIKDELTSKDTIKYAKNEDITENLSQFRDTSENAKSELLKKAEPKSIKFPSKMSNSSTNVSSDIPLEVIQNSSNMSKSEVYNVSKNLEDTSSEESLPPPQGITEEHRRKCSSVFTSENLSDSEGDLKTVYIEPESKFINMEQMANDPKFIQSQKRILESISCERQQTSSIKPKSHNDKGEYSKSLKIKGPKEVDIKVPKEAVFNIYELAQILSYKLETVGDNLDNLNQDELIHALMDLAERCDLDSVPHVPHVVINYREYFSESLEEISNAYERSMNERLGIYDRDLIPATLIESITELLPFFVNKSSSDSSTPEDEEDNISETDYPELNKNSTNEVKDTRYLKKFYKQKNPVLLPFNTEPSQSPPSPPRPSQSPPSPPRPSQSPPSQPRPSQ